AADLDEDRVAARVDPVARADRAPRVTAATVGPTEAIAAGLARPVVHAPTSVRRTDRRWGPRPRGRRRAPTPLPVPGVARRLRAGRAASASRSAPTSRAWDPTELHGIPSAVASARKSAPRR